MLVLLLLWVPVAAPIALMVSDSNLVTILTMGLLFVEFLFLVKFWGRKVYQQPQLIQSYGLVGTRRNARELLTGLSIGLLVTLSLFFLEGQLRWLEWQPSAGFLPRVILEGLLSALGIGLAEELVFRGWLLDELQRDYRLRAATWVDAILFAVLHFLKPFEEILRTWPKLPGLVLLGLTLVWAKQGRAGRLGLPIGLHAGLVWGYYIIDVGQLMHYTDRVPDWITGVDRNPLAGVVGLIFLSGLAFWSRRRVRLG